MRRVHPAVLALLTSCPLSATAIEVEALDARVSGDAYRVRFEARLAAPVEQVAGVLTDYAGYAALDPQIRASEVIGSTAAGEVLLRTRVRACALFFCRTVRRTERVTRGAGFLHAEVLPSQSDLRRGTTHTEWRGESGLTRIRYEAEFAPSFWVPDVVARRYAAGTLRESVQQLFENVEARARGH